MNALRPSLQRGFFSSLWWLFSSAIAKKTNNLEESILEVSCINTRGNAGRDHWNGEKANTPPKTVPRVSLILVFWEEKVVGCVTQRKKCWVHSEAVLSHLGAHYSCEVSRWKYVPFSNECTRGQNPALKELVVTNRKFVVNKKYRLQRKKIEHRHERMCPGSFTALLYRHHRIGFQLIRLIARLEFFYLTFVLAFWSPHIQLQSTPNLLQM